MVMLALTVPITIYQHVLLTRHVNQRMERVRYDLCCTKSKFLTTEYCKVLFTIGKNNILKKM